MNYERLQLIGRGGITEVYRARHHGSGSLFAIKYLRDEFCGNEEIVERFVREMKICRRLEHRNIVPIRDLGRDKQPYVVMELLDGETLRERLRRGPIPANQAKSIMEQVVLALGEAHRMGVVHRDLKPSNVFLCKDGLVKVMDFGMARVAAYVAAMQPDFQFSVAEYMSPEQIKGNVITERSDLYSLGIILYEMLAGRAPFQAESAEAIMQKHLTEPPPPVVQSVSPQLQSVLGKLLQKDPVARFSAAHHVWEALRPHEVPDSLYKKSNGSERPEPFSAVSPLVQNRSEDPAPTAANGKMHGVAEARPSSSPSSGISRRDISPDEPIGWAARRKRRSSPTHAETQRPPAEKQLPVVVQASVIALEREAPLVAAPPVMPPTASVTAPMPENERAAAPVAVPIATPPVAAPKTIPAPALTSAPDPVAVPSASVVQLRSKSRSSISRAKSKPAASWIKTMLQTAGVVTVCGTAFILLPRIVQTLGNSSGTQPVGSKISVPERAARKPGSAAVPESENARPQASSTGEKSRAAEMLSAPPLEEASRSETRTTRKLQTIAYEMEERKTASLPSGARRMVRNGRTGVRSITVEVTYQDGRYPKWCSSAQQARRQDRENRSQNGERGRKKHRRSRNPKPNRDWKRNRRPGRRIPLRVFHLNRKPRRNWPRSRLAFQRVRGPGQSRNRRLARRQAQDRNPNRSQCKVLNQRRNRKRKQAQDHDRSRIPLIEGSAACLCDYCHWGARRTPPWARRQRAL
jgi:serine/threonine protein kinase